MTYKQWAEEYFGKDVDAPAACRDAWNAAVQACAKVCDDTAKALDEGE